MKDTFFSTRNLAFLIFVLAAGFWAYHRLNPLVFNPVNGDFQTFNPVSRFLDGQFPYQDFANYLGVGPLLLTTMASLPGGANFASSVAGTEILVSFAFLYMATLAFRLLGTPRPWLFAIGLYLFGRLDFFFGLLPRNVLFDATGTLIQAVNIFTGLKFLVAPGHSLMPLRALWPFLAVLPLLLYLRKPGRDSAVLLGVILGAGVLWSNDYGPATALALGIVATIAHRNVAHTTLAVLAAIGGFAVSLMIITGGHPVDWFVFNRGVSEDQFWYFYFPDYKTISLDTIQLNDTTYVFLLSIFAGYLFFRRARGSRTPEAMGFFAVYLATLIASTLSIIGSAWFTYYLSAPLFLCVAGGLSHYAPAFRDRLDPDGKPFRLVLAVVVVAFLTGFALHPHLSPRNNYEKALGARLNKLYDGFPEMMTRVESVGPNIWSTYTTAIEASLGLRQASGQDYIIHALGIQGRTKYLAEFHRRKPSMVITPRPDKILWEVWSRIVNWWFYRELLRDYVPVGNGPFWTLWEQRVDASLPLKELACVLHHDAPGVVRVEIRGGAAVAGHVADVSLNYHATAGNLSRLLIEVEDEGLKRQYTAAIVNAGLDTKDHIPQSSVGFPPSAGLWRIPVQLDETGVGTSTLHANRRSRMGADLKVSACTAIDWAPAGRIDK